MKKKAFTLAFCIAAFGAVLNYIGGMLALSLHLPVYLDTLGTMITALLLGPAYALIPGTLSGLIGFFTSDSYALFYIPVQLVTGAAAGFFLYPYKNKKKWTLPFSALAVSIPGSIAGSLITAFLFGGITSSGSSVFVKLFQNAGMNLTASVFSVQFLTDYFDRLLTIIFAVLLFSALPSDIRQNLAIVKKQKTVSKRMGGSHGTL